MKPRSPRSITGRGPQISIVACSAVDPAPRAARLLPKSRLFTKFPMRLPNWMARLTRAAARGRPKFRSTARRMRLSPSPGHGNPWTDAQHGVSTLPGKSQRDSETRQLHRALEWSTNAHLPGGKSKSAIRGSGNPCSRSTTVSSRNG